VSGGASPPRPVALVLLCCACLVLASCPAPVEEPSATVTDPFEGLGGAEPLDALTRRFGRVRTRLRERGYGDEIGRGRLFALEGDGVALPIDLAVDRCTTFVALGGGGLRDLLMSVYDGDGNEVAVDAVEGEGALVHVCPQPTDDSMQPAPHHLVVRSAQGAGAVVVGGLSSPANAGEGFDGLFDGILAPRVPFQDVEEKLAVSRTLLRARGLLPVADPLIDSVAEGEGLRVSILLEAGSCYVAIGRAGEGVRDADLILLDAAGAEVARDLESNAEPSLSHCPERSGRHTFEVRSFEGAGALGLMVLGGPPAEADPGSPTDGPAPEAEATAPQDAAVDDPVAALEQASAVLQGRDYDPPVVIVRDGYIAPGEVRNHDVPVEPGCVVVLGAAGRPDTDLDLYLSERGAAVDRDTGVQPTARVRACPTERTVLRVSVKSYGRRGSFALAVLRAPEGIRDVRELRMEEAGASQRARGYNEISAFEATLEEGEMLERQLSARPGTCFAIAAAGDVSVEDLDVFLRDREGHLVASESGPDPFGAVGLCVEDGAEVLNLQVVMYRGGGAVAVRRFEGPP